MALIAMCCYDTIENKRSNYTRQTLLSLSTTVDWSKHRLIVIDNNSCLQTKDLLQIYMPLVDRSIAALIGNYGPKIRGMEIITLDENAGTANAINKAIKKRFPGENIIKIDNDCVIHQSGWVEELEEAISRDNTIGILGLKRKDLAEWPLEDGWAHSELLALPHQPGQRWMVVEAVCHVMGTCQMLSSKLLDTLGFFYQGDGIVYGFDDSLLSLRSTLSGFKNCFLPHIDIDHIDTGAGEYVNWKHQYAGEKMEQYNQICEEYKTGIRSLYYDGN